MEGLHGAGSKDDGGPVRKERRLALQDKCSVENAAQLCLFILFVARAKLTAEALAEILNGFVEEISYKSMVMHADCSP